jgi:VanZ family protein
VQLQAGKPAPGIVRIGADSRAEQARRGHYLAGVLALIFFVAIVAASFYPFQPIHDPVMRAARLQRFLRSIGPNPGNLERLEPGHLCLNFFFYFPLGALVAAALRRGVKGAGPWLLHAGALGLGFLISLTIEYQQIGFNGRDPDLSDTVMNTLGYVAGFGLIRGLMRRGRFRTESLSGRGGIRP